MDYDLGVREKDTGRVSNTRKQPQVLSRPVPQSFNPKSCAGAMSAERLWISGEEFRRGFQVAPEGACALLVSFLR